MNEGIKRAPLCLLGGTAAAFMVYLILVDWSLVIMVVLTSVVYGSAGYILRRVVKRELWYSGGLDNVPFGLLLISWGFEELRSRSVILVFGLVSTYAGI